MDEEVIDVLESDMEVDTEGAVHMVVKADLASDFYTDRSPRFLSNSSSTSMLQTTGEGAHKRHSPSVYVAPDDEGWIDDSYSAFDIVAPEGIEDVPGEDELFALALQREEEQRFEQSLEEQRVLAARAERLAIERLNSQDDHDEVNEEHGSLQPNRSRVSSSRHLSAPSSRAARGGGRSGAARLTGASGSNTGLRGQRRRRRLPSSFGVRNETYALNQHMFNDDDFAVEMGLADWIYQQSIAMSGDGLSEEATYEVK